MIIILLYRCRQTNGKKIIACNYIFVNLCGAIHQGVVFQQSHHLADVPSIVNIREPLPLQQFMTYINLISASCKHVFFFFFFYSA